MLKKDLMTGCIWLCVFGFLLSRSFSHPDELGYWPRMLFATGVFFSCVLLGSTAVKMMARGRDGDASGASIFPVIPARVFVSVALILGWIVSFGKLGYLVTTATAVTMLILLNEPVRSRRNVIRDVAAGILFPTAMFLIFRALGVQFPRGFLI